MYLYGELCTAGESDALHTPWQVLARPGKPFRLRLSASEGIPASAPGRRNVVRARSLRVLCVGRLERPPRFRSSAFPGSHAHRRRRNAAMLRDGAPRGGVASTSSALPALCAGSTGRVQRCRGQPALGAKRAGAAPAGASQHRRRLLPVNASATFAVEVADKLSSGYGARLRLACSGPRSALTHAPRAPPQSFPLSSILGALGSTRWALFRCPALWQAL